MLELDYSWESLFKPGEATSYFNTPGPIPLQAGIDSFNSSNAWWLAEISRLIYHNDFFNDKNISLGSFKYEKIGYIENKNTSTHIAILKIIQESPCIVIVFRGTDEIDDWNINFNAYQSPFSKSGKVHNGFKKAYLSIKEELQKFLVDNSLPIFVCGHSLGAALAILATSELHTNKHFDSCYTFGSPRIGNQDFFDSIKHNRIYRVINNSDIITTVPIDFAGIIYKHIGSSFLINNIGKLIEGLNEDEIYNYQKDKLAELKEHAVSKLFNNGLKSIKNNIPSFLAEHSPINYVTALTMMNTK